MNLRKKSTREEFERTLAQCTPEDFDGHTEFYRLTPEQRLEWLKALALTNWGSSTLKAGTTTEGYGAIADASLYRRVTTITDSPGGACAAHCKLVQVTVFYRPVTGRGQLDQERRLDVITMLVTRS